MSAAQAELFISLSKKEVTVGETLDLIIDYNDPNKDNLKFPLHTDAYDVIGDASSSSVNVINGKVTQTKRQVYTLLFKKTGIINLPITELKSDNQIQANPNYQIRVTPKTGASTPSSTTVNPRPTTNNYQKPRKQLSNLFARLELSNNKPYINEQILLKLKIYHRGNLKNISLPELDLGDFIHKRLENDSKEYQEVVEGRRYMVYEIPYLIFPIKAGINNIPSTEIDLITVGKAAQIDPFDPFTSFSRAFSQENIVKIRTNALKVETLGLPKPSPANFTGYVGELSVNHSIKSSSINKNDLAVLSTSIYGNGNPNNIPSNLIEESNNFHLYKDRESKSLEVNKGIEYFNLESSTAIIPENTLQKFKIKTKKLVNFNPNTKSYEVHEAKEFNIDIKHSLSSTNPSEPDPNETPIKSIKRKIKKVDLNELVSINQSKIENFKSIKFQNLYLLLAFLLINLFSILKHLYNFYKINFKGLKDVNHFNEAETKIKNNLDLTLISKEIKELKRKIYEKPEDKEKLENSNPELRDRIELFIENTDRMNYGVKFNSETLASDDLKNKALNIVKELKAFYG
ncbi:MAG: BatD family protein [Candidatus Caenarcaniphilales bacterium]|nr:BatD family protein [Candidatus Caenarcaniphilales bacterium]